MPSSLHAPQFESSPAAEPPANQEGSLEAILARVAHWLPAQGPIKDFIHHNTLHAFQHLRFHDGVSAAARLYGAPASMPGPFYWEAYQAGRITESGLARALELALPDPQARAEARARMLAGPLSAPEFPGVARAGLRAIWTDRLGGVALERRSHLPLFRLIGAYLDQGISVWGMPDAAKAGFFEAVAGLARRSRFPLKPFDVPAARELLALPAREALDRALDRIVGRRDLFEPYLLETLLVQPGWAGMVAECERRPEGLLEGRRITLLEYAAVTLVAELGCLERELGPGFAPIAAAERHPPLRRDPDAVPALQEAEVLLSIWHDAFEWSYHEELLGAVVAPRRRPARPARTSAWAICCLDDRFSSLRQYVAEVAPEIETFATAGFFGLDFMYRGARDAVAGKHCPAPMTPRHLVVEWYEEGTRPTDARARWWQRPIYLESQSNTFWRGWLLSYALGLGSAVRLAASVFRPSFAPVIAPRLSSVDARARFRLLRRGDERDENGLWLGYTADELADRLLSVFRSMGTPPDWPELVVVLGHGSSSVNNPYFAAYNCGACSGRSGAPNARAFAKAANMPEVRAALRARGLDIPDRTWVMGALYDTTRDEVTWYDEHRLPERFREPLARFHRSLGEAAALNAAERCRRFETVPAGLSPGEAIQEVRLRSVSLFEPRPEYNHATNAACLVGRAAFTEGLFLDRRAFLSSYDPARDPDGSILADILAAVVPVCAGINLEYFFSRLAPRPYGAGSKLPHNVNGLLGVCNGVEGDLLTGLPTQMTEIHDPVRLLLVVEQAPAVALDAARRRPSVHAWVENEWIRFACVDPASGRPFLYQAGAMVPLQGLPAPTRRWPSALAASRQGRENLPLAVIAPPRPAA